MTDRIAPWTLKNIQPEVRNAAIAAAARERMTIGDWMSRAVLARVQSDSQQDRAPAVIRAEPVTLDDIGRMLELARTLADVTGKPAPRSIVGPTAALLRRHVRGALR